MFLFCQLFKGSTGDPEWVNLAILHRSEKFFFIVYVQVYMLMEASIGLIVLPHANDIQL